MRAAAPYQRPRRKRASVSHSTSHSVRPPDNFVFQGMAAPQVRRPYAPYDKRVLQELLLVFCPNIDDAFAFHMQVLLLLLTGP